MDGLTVRLEALLRLYVAAADTGQGSVRLAEQFRKNLTLLRAKYGPSVVDAALENLPDEAWPSVSLQ